MEKYINSRDISYNKTTKDNNWREVIPAVSKENCYILSHLKQCKRL